MTRNATDPAALAPAAFQVMAKPRGAVCNLNCAYCYFLAKERLYPGSSFRMTDELLEKYTRDYMASQRAPTVTFVWQGGEPSLMGLDFFKRAVELQNKYGRPDMQVCNAFQTNGVLLTADWCRFFKENDFLVGISVDGPEELHDHYRRDRAGGATLARVMAGLSLLREHGVDYNVLAAVHAANAPHPLRVYRFLRDEIGTRFIQFIPIVERQNDTGFQEGDAVTDRSVSAKQYGDFLIAVFDEWVRRDVGCVFVQIFDVALGAWSGHASELCVFAEHCGEALAMEHNGDLYSCDHFIEPRYKLGNIREVPLLEMVASAQQRRFGTDKRDRLPGYCRRCEVRFACNGGCPKNRIARTPDGEPDLNYLCAGYRAFFRHIDRPMRIMAAELRAGRPPANIMRYPAE